MPVLEPKSDNRAGWGHSGPAYRKRFRQGSEHFLSGTRVPEHGPMAVDHGEDLPTVGTNDHIAHWTADRRIHREPGPASGHVVYRHATERSTLAGIGLVRHSKCLSVARQSS